MWSSQRRLPLGRGTLIKGIVASKRERAVEKRQRTGEGEDRGGNRAKDKQKGLNREIQALIACSWW